jgi:predicted Zn-dependent protease
VHSGDRLIVLHRLSVLHRAAKLLWCLALVLSVISASQLAAQQFLACDRAGVAGNSKVSAHQEWLRDAQNLLHAFAGDDLNAYFGFKPQLQLVEHRAPNAFALRPGSIVVSSGLMELTGSSSEFAFIIAHELGHLLAERGDHAHTLAPIQAREADTMAAELAADAFAMRLLRSRGFDPTAGIEVLRKIEAATRRSGASPEALYPTIESRIVAMNLPTQ